MTDRTPASPVEDPETVDDAVRASLEHAQYWHAYPSSQVGAFLGALREHGYEVAALQAQDHTITKGGLDVERLARALHEAAPESHHRRKCRDRHDIIAVNIAREYAALEPTHD